MFCAIFFKNLLFTCVFTANNFDIFFIFFRVFKKGADFSIKPSFGFVKKDHFCFIYDSCIILVILDRPPWPHSMLIIGWLSSKPISQAIWALESIPLLCYISYLIPSGFSYWLLVSSHATSSLHFFSSLPFSDASRSLARTQVDTLLFTLPPRKLGSRSPNRSLTEVQN